MEDDFYTLTDEYDHAILMHRDAHFSGSFSAMLEYYEEEGKGAMPEFEIFRIRSLAAMEEEDPLSFENFLSETEVEEVTKARKLYQKLRATYEDKKPAPVARAIADLLLSEEVDPVGEIEQLAALGAAAVDPLISLLLSEDFYNPLFPGYGYAPAAAAIALGKIGDARAVAPLFQTMGREDFFTEASLVDALEMLGEPARVFLLGRLRHQPITHENTQAAIALAPFKDHPDVTATCLDLLEKIAFENKHRALATYLVLNCGHTKDKRLEQLTQNPLFPKELNEEIRYLS